MENKSPLDVKLHVFPRGNLLRDTLCFHLVHVAVMSHGSLKSADLSEFQVYSFTSVILYFFFNLNVRNREYPGVVLFSLNCFKEIFVLGDDS